MCKIALFWMKQMLDNFGAKHIFYIFCVINLHLLFSKIFEVSDLQFADLLNWLLRNCGWRLWTSTIWNCGSGLHNLKIGLRTCGSDFIKIFILLLFAAADYEIHNLVSELRIGDLLVELSTENIAQRRGQILPAAGSLTSILPRCYHPYTFRTPPACDPFAHNQVYRRTCKVTQSKGFIFASYTLQFCTDCHFKTLKVLLTRR